MEFNIIWPALIAARPALQRRLLKLARSRHRGWLRSLRREQGLGTAILAVLFVAECLAVVYFAGVVIGSPTLTRAATGAAVALAMVAFSRDVEIAAAETGLVAWRSSRRRR